MVPRWSPLLIAVPLAALAACDAPASATLPARPAVVAPARRQLRDLSMRVSYEMIQLRARIERRFELVDHRSKPCAADTFQLDPADAETAVVGFGVADARSDAKTLLPTAFTEALPSVDLAPIARHFRTPAESPASFQDVAPAFRLLKSEADGAAALEELARLRRRRYQAVLHLIDFREAALIYDLRHNRREWAPGAATAWLAIHDADSGNALCQTLVSATNDTEGVSVARRSREDMRGRLIAALGAGLRREALAALPRLARELRAPADYAAPDRLALAPK